MLIWLYNTDTKPVRSIDSATVLMYFDPEPRDKQ